MERWKYYNRAIISALPPHIENVYDNKNCKNIWAEIGGNKALLIRWITDWDCGYETQWWYCIKDTPMSLEQLKTKRRYEVKKGIKNFDIVKVDNPLEYKEEIYEVWKSAFSVYPKSYRPQINFDNFQNDINNWDQYNCFIAKSKEDGKICGYALLKDENECALFEVEKSVPEQERKGINAAIVYGVLSYYEDRLKENNFYISDGSRNIMHETNFQSYLEKYFGFRKAYCKLNIRYKKGVKFLVNCLYPFRIIVEKFSGIKFIKKINAVLKMEEICRSYEKR